MNTITLENAFSIDVIACMSCLVNDEIMLCQLGLEAILWFHGLMLYQDDIAQFYAFPGKIEAEGLT